MIRTLWGLLPMVCLFALIAGCGELSKELLISLGNDIVQYDVDGMT
jgi:hypothetical protein